MLTRPVISPGVVQAPNIQPVIPDGYTQRTPFRPLLPGNLAQLKLGPLTPPTVAPVLSVSAELGSYTANLVWTPSDKAGSAGFHYEVWVDEGFGPLLAGTTTDTFFDYTAFPPPGTYDFYVVPKNSAGGGPSSNTASVNLPGESSAHSILLEDGSELLLEDGTQLLLESAL
jgi:hypothetical protein